MMDIAKHDEVVADGGGPEGKNSIFTGHLVQGLKGAAADASGVITASGLMQYVYRHVGGDSRSNQTPHCGHLDGSGDMILKIPEGPVIDAVKHEDHLLGSDFSVIEADAKLVAEIRAPTFLAANGYGDTRAATFGQNEWTEKLGSGRRNDEGLISERADQYLVVVAEPVTNLSQPIDPALIVDGLRKRDWPSSPPYPKECLPEQLLTTLRSAVLYTPDGYGANEKWKRFLRIEDDGAIEFADCHHVCRQLNPIQGQPTQACWLYVQIIGFIWSILYLVKAVYTEMGYTRGIRLSINLVGTKQSALVDFAGSPGSSGKHWLDPLRGEGSINGILERTRCNDANIQIPFQVAIANLNDAEVKRIILEIATKLGRAYNHQSEPRCFIHGTQDYPWKEYSPRYH